MNSRILYSPSPSPEAESSASSLELPSSKHIKPEEDNSTCSSSLADNVGTIADALASMNPNLNQALYGCKLCGPAANCTNAHAKGYDLETAQFCKDDLIKQETAYFKRHNPQAEIEAMEEQKQEIEAEKLAADFPNGPFCCMKLVRDPRSDSAHIDEDKVEPIMLFIKEVSEGKGIYYAVEEDAYNDEQLKAVEKVFRMNRVGDDDNKGTYIYHPTEYMGTECFVGIIKIDEPHQFEQVGKNGYLGFVCKEHKCKYRVGYSYKHFIGKKKTIETFGDGRLDKLLKVKRLERLVLGYGGPGW
ncbi:hypothetical protein BKA61DRAFT_718650 [Leptodontidium sp. MPI-SDFR-AT-0119]|nr:hypothetical protein BKA61DRAFT_718650 [Leptodontidium sp. MPI-SDFR-AT-0119]